MGDRGAEEGEGMRVKEAMSHCVVTIDGQESLRVVAKRMAEVDLGSILVMSGGQVLGIITEADLVRRVLAREADPDALKAEEVMSAPVYAIDEGESLEQAREKMAGHRVRHLLVTSDGKPVGVISARNLLDLAPF